MSIEDIVKQALINKGHEIPLLEKTEQQVSSNPEPDTYTTIEQDRETETQQLIAEVMIEFIRRQKIPFAQLGNMRRVVKRVLLHLCEQTNACTLGSIRNVIDPRFRDYVKPILLEMTKQGILNMFDDDTAKAKWVVKHEYKTHAIMFATEK